MSQRSDQVASHALFKRLRTVRTVVEKVEGIGELTVEKTEITDRLRVVISHVEKVLDHLDPALIPLGVLNNLDNQLSNVQTECTAFTSDQNISHLTNADNHADTLLVQLSNLPRIMGVEELV